MAVDGELWEGHGASGSEDHPAARGDAGIPGPPGALLAGVDIRRRWASAGPTSCTTGQRTHPVPSRDAPGDGRKIRSPQPSVSSNDKPPGSGTSVQQHSPPPDPADGPKPCGPRISRAGTAVRRLPEEVASYDGTERSGTRWWRRSPGPPHGRSPESTHRAADSHDHGRRARPGPRLTASYAHLLTPAIVRDWCSAGPLPAAQQRSYPRLSADPRRAQQPLVAMVRTTPPRSAPTTPPGCRILRASQRWR